MNNSIEDKRKEIFELHQSWLRPETPLMRQPPPPPIVVEPKDEMVKTYSFKTNWVIVTVVTITLILVLLELLFFASELGWFN